MYRSFQIENYRCLRKVTLELGKFTVIVGPNASGKTALADALTATRAEEADWWQKDVRYQSRVGFHKTDGTLQGMQKRWDPPSGRMKYRLSTKRLRSFPQASEAWSVAEDGSNVANFFDTLSRADQERFVAEFTRLVPMYADVKARATNGMQRLQFEDRWKPGLWYEPGEVSDGTVLTAALLALAYQRDVPELAVIEDPDQGLHPYLQRQVVALLRKLASGEVGGKPVQIVCTTHSRAFLDCLEPEEVRFISRDPQTGETAIAAAPTDNPRWKDVYGRYQESLGRMWMTGALGGVPGN